MANHALPTISSTYVNFVSELQGRIDDSVKDNSTSNVVLVNPPTGLVRWNSTSYYWEINTGTAAAPVWNQRSTRYDININGTVGASAPNTGSFTTLTTSGIASLAANSTVGGQAITTASNTQTLTNKTLTTPVISNISNSGTISIPTGTDTLVARNTTDTLTNKTFTDPKVTTGSAIKDSNGVNLLKFPTTVASAVNFIAINNSVTAVAPSLVADGSDANISLDLRSKGTGSVTVNSVPVVTTSGTQTLTNKTLTTPVIASISNGGTITIPSGTDTFVVVSATQTLTNKTINSSAFNGTVGATTPSTGSFTTITASGDITSQGNVTSYSDARLKTDLVQVSDALASLKKLSGYYYTRLDTGERSLGLIAQEVQKVYPEVVRQGEYLSVSYGNMVALLLEAIKELDRKVERLYEKTI